MSKTNKKKYVGISTLEILEGAEKYNQWISEQISSQTAPPLMEFGAGTGNISKNLINHTPFTITERDPFLLKGLSNRFKDNKDVSFSSLDISKNPPKNLCNHFNTVYGVNVLEHIENDANALKNLYKTLNKNGKLILLVPAKKSAYTKLDKKLGHFRRYEKKELINLLTDSGYKVERVYYFNFVGIFAWKIREYIDRDDELNPMQIRLFDVMVPFLKFVENIIKPPIGVSLIIVASK
jgi:phospholipid N-methyltransferase